MFKYQTICPSSIVAMRRGSCQWLLLLLFGAQVVLPVESRVFAVQDGAAAQSSPEPALVLGVAGEREIGSGQKHSYQLVLSAGQYAKVTIHQPTGGG